MIVVVVVVVVVAVESCKICRKSARIGLVSKHFQKGIDTLTFLTQATLRYRYHIAWVSIPSRLECFVTYWHQYHFS